MNPVSSSASRFLCLAAFPALQRTLEFDRVTPGGVNRARKVAVAASGKAVNTARALRALGGEVCLLGFVGGETGRQLQADLAREGLPNHLLATQAPTRICQTLLDRAAGCATELVEESAVPPAEDWAALRAAFARRLAGADGAIVSGTLPPGAPEDFYADVLNAAREAGVVAVLDTHRDPLRRALAARPWLAKPNRDELALTFGAARLEDAEVLRLAHTLRERGADAVLVSDGPRPACLVTSRGAWWLTPPAVDARNPIGAGDVLGAGALWAHARGADDVEAARFGLACASASCLSETPGVVDPEAARAWAADVRVSRAADS